MANGIDKNAPRPRLCHLRRWTDFDGYGFNLHSDRNKSGQYIGKVDADSPAESAGLRKNDRIVEVNYAPIGNETHRQVVTRIKEGVTRNGVNYPDEVVLLVVDEETDEYYKNAKHVIRSNDPNVMKLETEIRHTAENDNSSSSSSSRSIRGRRDSSPPSPSRKRDVSPPKRSNDYDREYTNATTYPTKTSSPAISRTSDQAYDSPIESGSHRQHSPPSLGRTNHQDISSMAVYAPINPKTQVSSTNSGTYNPTNSPKTSASNNGVTGLGNLEMSAAEYREMLKVQKSRRRDPRQSSQMSMKQKRDIINDL